MISLPDQATEEALARLDNDIDFEAVMKWIRSELYVISVRNDEQVDDVMLRQGQGAAQVLRSIVEVADNARRNIQQRRR